MTPKNQVRQFEHTRWEDALGYHPVWATNLTPGKRLRIASELLEQLEFINLALIGAVNELHSRQHKSIGDSPALQADHSPSASEPSDAIPWTSTKEIRQTIELLSAEPPSALTLVVEVQEITLATCKKLQGQPDQKPSGGSDTPERRARFGPIDLAASLRAIVSHSHPLPPTFAQDLVGRLTTLYTALFDEALRAASAAE